MQQSKILQKQILYFINNPPDGANAIYYDNDKSVYIRLVGPQNSPYEGGEFILKIELVKDWPFSPPDFKMLTPSGRFEPEKSICTSFSKFHSTGWSPAISLNVLALSLLSFMMDNDTKHVGATIVPYDDNAKKVFAGNSKRFNSSIRVKEGLLDSLLSPCVKK